ncbi:MAG: PASTA domain-containing protein [Crocinitomicaceae bacterium]
MIQRLKDFIISKHFLKHFGLVILFYLVLVFVVSLYLDFSTNHGEKIEVPNFVGLNGETAKQKIEELGLQYQIVDSIYDPNSPEGTVVEQLVEPTSVSQVYVKSGRIIGLRLTKRSQLIEMPGLINKQIQFAESILEQRGLRFRIQYRPTSEANGSVLDQLYKGKRVKEGDRIPMGAVITLIVGQNDLGEPIPLMNFVGMSMDEARYVMDTMGVTSYTFVCPECSTREDSLAAKIFSQTPEFIEGTTAYKSTQFTFSMKLGFDSEIDFP